MHKTQSLPRLVAALALVCLASLTRGDAVAVP